MRNDACVLVFPDAFIFERQKNEGNLKGMSDSPFKNITVGTVISTTTTASPNTPRSTFAMETCPR